MKKVIVIGESNTGKTTFTSCLRDIKVLPTIGIDCFTYKNLYICDTSGSECYKYLVRSFYDQQDVFLICFRTLDQLYRIGVQRNYINIIIYNGEDEMLRDKGRLYAKEHGVKFFSCSFVNKVDCNWIWNRIIDTTTTKQWRNLYCWFY